MKATMSALSLNLKRVRKSVRTELNTGSLALVTRRSLSGAAQNCGASGGSETKMGTISCGGCYNPVQSPQDVTSACNGGGV